MHAVARAGDDAVVIIGDRVARAGEADAVAERHARRAVVSGRNRQYDRLRAGDRTGVDDGIAGPGAIDSGLSGDRGAGPVVKLRCKAGGTTGILNAADHAGVAASDRTAAQVGQRAPIDQLHAEAASRQRTGVDDRTARIELHGAAIIIGARRDDAARVVGHRPRGLEFDVPVERSRVGDSSGAAHQENAAIDRTVGVVGERTAALEIDGRVAAGGGQRAIVGDAPTRPRSAEHRVVAARIYDRVGAEIERSGRELVGVVLIGVDDLGHDRHESTLELSGAAILTPSLRPGDVNFWLTMLRRGALLVQRESEPGRAVFANRGHALTQKLHN